MTSHATAVSNITWSPDGSTIYFRAADPKSDEQKAREKLKDDVFMFDEDYQQQHLWSVAVAGKTEHRITQGDFSVLSYDLSEDGKKIALHRAPTPLIEDSDQSEVWVMDAGGANARQITHNQVQESDATLSPDGSQVLFLSQANPKFETYYNRKMFVAPAGGGDVARAHARPALRSRESVAGRRTASRFSSWPTWACIASCSKCRRAGRKAGAAHQRQTRHHRLDHVRRRRTRTFSRRMK